MARRKRPLSDPADHEESPASEEATEIVQVTGLSVYSLVLPDGKIPFTDWLVSLRDRTATARIVLRIRRIAATGNFGDCKIVGEGVWELKVDYGPGYRVYYGRVGTQVVLLLAGGDKSTQENDIILAKARWNFFEKARKGNNDADGSLGRRFEGDVS